MITTINQAFNVTLIKAEKTWKKEGEIVIVNLQVIESELQARCRISLIGF